MQNRSGAPSYQLPNTVQTVVCYYCQIYEGETLVRSFVPCQRVSDGAAGMYDNVHDVFYPNAGTGTLVCGGKPSVTAVVSDYIGPVQPGGCGIGLQVTVPLNGAGCSYLWSKDDGATWSPTEPRFTEVGSYTVISEISCTGYYSSTYTGHVQVVDHQAEWTYDDAKKTLSDNVWVLGVTKDGDELTVTGCAGSAFYPNIQLDLSKPIAGGLSVVGIGNNAFDTVEDLSSVTLPDTLRLIGNFAFRKCSGLKKVTPFLPPSVTTIGCNAFDYCKALACDLTVGSVDGEPTQWLKQGGAYTGAQFASSGITSARFLSATNAPDWLCVECPALTNLVFSDGLREIGNEAFRDNPVLARVTPLLPAALERIGHRAFFNCSGLDGDLVVGRLGGPAVVWYDGGTVGSSGLQFSHCPSLRSATFNAVTELPNDCFNFCSSLTNVVFNCEPVSIGRYAFGSCKALKNVTPFLPTSVTNVGGYAFYQCNNLVGDLTLSRRKAGLTFDSRYDPNGSWTDHQFAEIYGLRSLTINGDFVRLPKDFCAMDSALETVRINSRTDIVFGTTSFGGWSGHNPPIRDLYVNSFATFESEVFRYRPAQKLRFWVPADNVQWQTWVAANVDLWEDLTDDQRASYYAEFGENAKRPVGLTHSDVQPTTQWLMWVPKGGLILFVQ